MTTTKMNTEEALKEIFEKRAWYRDFNINESTARSWKKQYKNGKMTFETKEKILLLTGYKKAQDVDWIK